MKTIFGPRGFLISPNTVVTRKWSLLEWCLGSSLILVWRKKTKKYSPSCNMSTFNQCYMSIYTCITLCKLGYFKMYRTYLCFQLTNKYLAHLFYTLPIIVFFVASQHTSTCFTMIKLASYMKQVLILRVNHVHMTVTPFITLHFTTKPWAAAMGRVDPWV